MFGSWDLGPSDTRRFTERRMIDTLERSRLLAEELAEHRLGHPTRITERAGRRATRVAPSRPLTSPVPALACGDN